MSTQPLKPTTAIAPATTTATPPASALKTPAKTASTSNTSTAGLSAPVAASVNFNRAKVQSQPKSDRTSPAYAPVSLQVQEGEFKGRFLDLGIEVGEVNHEQTAEWEVQKGDGVRAGANFKKLSPRSISFSCGFFVLNEDVAQLAENLAILHQITIEGRTPPKCLLIQGTLRAQAVYCKSIKEKFTAPHPKDKGYRRVIVELVFELAGGKNSPDSMGKPLAPNSQTDWKNSTTATERDRVGNLQVAQSLLSPSLTPKAEGELTSLIQNNQLKSVPEVSKLDSNAFIQGVTAGVFNKGFLKSPAIANKLKIDLAAVLAANEDGAGLESRKLADAILKSDPAGLSPKLQKEFDKIRGDYDTILDAMQSQQLDDKSSHKVFSRAKGGTALARLMDVAAPGLALRNAGGAGIGQPQGNEKETIDAINKFIASNTDEQIKKKFNLTTETQLIVLKNSAPYTTKAQFLQEAARGSTTVKGFDLWATFTEDEPTLPTVPEEPIPPTEEEDL